MNDRLALLKYKGNRCAHCGKTVDEVLRRFGTIKLAFQFNHVDPAKKDPDYDNLIRRSISTEQLDELDKCVLLCPGCHGHLHAQNIVTRMTMSCTVKEGACSQTVAGQILLDADLGASFFTDEIILVHPYWVTIGDEPTTFMFGESLKTYLTTSTLIHTRTTKRFQVRSYVDRSPMYEIQKIDEDTFRILYSSRFHLTKMDCLGMWIRQGKAVTEAGEIFENFRCTFVGYYDSIVAKSSAGPAFPAASEWTLPANPPPE